MLVAFLRVFTVCEWPVTVCSHFATYKTLTWTSQRGPQLVSHIYGAEAGTVQGKATGWKRCQKDCKSRSADRSCWGSKFNYFDMWKRTGRGGGWQQQQRCTWKLRESGEIGGEMRSCCVCLISLSNMTQKDNFLFCFVLSNNVNYLTILIYHYNVI